VEPTPAPKAADLPPPPDRKQMLVTVEAWEQDAEPEAKQDFYAWQRDRGMNPMKKHDERGDEELAEIWAHVQGGVK
jgi:hypothetical protein